MAKCVSCSPDHEGICSICGELPEETKYPEHEKLKLVVGESNACGAFIDFLESKGIFLCEIPDEPEDYDDDEASDEERAYYSHFTRTRHRIEDLLGEHFGIDPKKISNEKDQMVRELQEAARKRTD